MNLYNTLVVRSVWSVVEFVLLFFSLLFHLSAENGNIGYLTESIRAESFYEHQSIDFQTIKQTFFVHFRRQIEFQSQKEC